MGLFGGMMGNASGIDPRAAAKEFGRLLRRTSRSTPPTS